MAICATQGLQWQNCRYQLLGHRDQKFSSVAIR
jgi:hypothetical protein